MIDDVEPVLSAAGVDVVVQSSDGATISILDGFDLSIQPQELVAIVGPSGAGKTTLLRVLSGLMPVTRGSVTFRGRPVRSVPEELSVVFQEYNKSLFPWLTLQRNVEVRVRSLPRRERATLAQGALAQVGLGDAGGRYPHEVSGGMQQRAALARSIVVPPALLLLDEPFASVDALTRMQLEDVVLALRHEIGCAALLVTHDVSEAVYMADRVLVVSPRPARVIEVIEVALPRPRNQVETKRLSAFQEHYERALALITGAT